MLGPQGRQADDGAELYLPIGQARHVVPVEYVPGGQEAHAVIPDELV